MMPEGDQARGDEAVSEARTEAAGDEPAPRPLHGPAARVMARLLAERGLVPGEWWPFLVQGEGTSLPGGLEALSGFVLALDGRVYGWWLGWEPDDGVGGQEGGAPEGRYVLDRWWRVDAPEAEFAGDAEYAAARRRLGLSRDA
jgi:hypothetical protein